MAKKTISVEYIRGFVNDSLQNSTCSPDVREGMIALLERTLHETGNYHGFRYLDACELPPNQMPGIMFVYEDGNRKPVFPKDETDETRRHYF